MLLQGSPNLVLGSSTATALVAGAVATMTVATAYRLRRRDAVRLALGGGLGYSLALVALWAGVLTAFWRLPGDPVAEPVGFLAFVAVGVIGLGIQAGLPLFLLASRGLVAPLAPLFVGTGLATYMFLGVAGESDALVIYLLVIAPLVLGGTVLLGALEAAIRWLLDRGDGGDGPPA